MPRGPVDTTMFNRVENEGNYSIICGQEDTQGREANF